ncbi:MAG: hypothetical protein MI867_22005 [Pseudomonadales bacterium]|nr:hypothetical protein [Pseudomonadales bacterium]
MGRITKFIGFLLLAVFFSGCNSSLESNSTYIRSGDDLIVTWNADNTKNLERVEIRDNDGELLHTASENGSLEISIPTISGNHIPWSVHADFYYEGNELVSKEKTFYVDSLYHQLPYSDADFATCLEQSLLTETGEYGTDNPNAESPVAWWNSLVLGEGNSNTLCSELNSARDLRFFEGLWLINLKGTNLSPSEISKYAKEVSAFRYYDLAEHQVLDLSAIGNVNEIVILSVENVANVIISPDEQLNLMGLYIDAASPMPDIVIEPTLFFNNTQFDSSILKNVNTRWYTWGLTPIDPPEDRNHLRIVIGSLLPGSNLDMTEVDTDLLSKTVLHFLTDDPQEMANWLALTGKSADDFSYITYSTEFSY